MINFWPIYSQGQKNKTDVFINVNVPKYHSQDTMTLYRYRKVLSKRTSRYLNHITYRAIKEEGAYHFRIPNVKEMEYIVLGDHNFRGSEILVPILEYYPLQPGDSITLSLEWDSTYHADEHLVPVTVNYVKKMIPSVEYFPQSSYFYQYRLKFSGKGSYKYQCRYLVNRAYAHGADKMTIDRLLNTYSSRMTHLAWGVLKADVIGRYEEKIFHHHFSMRESSMRLKTDRYFRNVTAKSTVSREAKEFSRFYPYSIIERTRFIFPRRAHDQIIKFISKKYDGCLRDQALTIYSLENRLSDKALKYAYSLIVDSTCRRILRNFIKHQELGTKAYDFSLTNKDGNVIKLSDFRGKVVFLDFWFTGCHACSGFYQKQLSEVEKKFNWNDQVVFISISIDKNRSKWLKSVDKGLYSSSNAVNVYTGGKGERVPLIEEYSVTGYPSLFLIGRDGKIKARKASLSHKNAIIKAINRELITE